MEVAAAGGASESPSTEGIARSGKRAREELQPFDDQLIKDEEHDSEPGEAGAVVPSESPSPTAAESIRVGKAMLRCSLCSHALKKPIYQCAAGHLACCGCRVKLPDNGCRRCRAGGAATKLAHSPGLDAFFDKVQVPCPFEQYGCRSFVPYFKAAGHQGACAHAPCFCPEPSCFLVCAPRALAAHLAAEHAWPAHEVLYGTPVLLPLPVPPAATSPARAHRRLLRGDDASLFLMAVGPLGEGGGAAVSLVHVRTNSPAHQRFTCTFYADAPPGAAGLEGGYFFATVPVRSTALADGDGVAPEKGLYFAVPPEMLREGEAASSSRVLLLSVRIDRSFGHEAPGLDDHH